MKKTRNSINQEFKRDDNPDLFFNTGMVPPTDADTAPHMVPTTVPTPTPPTDTDTASTTGTEAAPTPTALPFETMEPNEKLIRSTSYYTSKQKKFIEKLAKKYNVKEAAICRKFADIIMKQLGE